MRGLVAAMAAISIVAAGLGAAAAQTPPRPVSTSNLRPMPDAPGKRAAELQGLDKVTARTQRFYAPVGQATRFGTLEITVADCLVNVPEAPPESVAYLTIVDNKPGQAAEKLFAGWMFASTPSLSALDHGVYDIRVLACTMAQGSAPPSSR
ncbi:MAG: hypothetical protein A3D94_14005 [Alphaproteobacteria bacterium RIFCSPHIGHO2_12_FULL_66_14]|jgi:hypothetical protein|nr:MAG: hypothetical protein A3D94_14005 [Alphaproteobacteria bacterium RIFCSPHIGHO2_12_FULL_66_14]